MPGPVQDRVLRPIQTDRQVKGAGAGRQPVRLAFRSRVFALDIEIERTVRIEPQLVAIADGITVDLKQKDMICWLDAELNGNFGDEVPDYRRLPTRAAASRQENIAFSKFLRISSTFIG
jgi:hypothetical protein